MNPVELIRAKRDGGTLNRAQLATFVRDYLDGRVEEYQMSAFLMAVFLRGMEAEETAAFTEVMRDSGDRFDWSDVAPVTVDKHSTGGVGDKVSLILLPLVAAAGGIDPMVSGRGLGHTGGTLDKLDSIPGYRWGLTKEEATAVLRRIGCVSIGQTDNFVPADKRLYRLRDVTATVESIPLITASILSKKAAAGVNALVMDVKMGSGAFMSDADASRALAKSLVATGKALGLKVEAMLTKMDEPLGAAVGNALEVIEAIDILAGRGPADATDVTLALTARMLVMGGLDKDDASATTRLRGLIASGKAMEKFAQWVESQGGDPRVIDKPALLPAAPDRAEFRAPRAGIVQSIQTRNVGLASNALGAGRVKFTDVVDHAVGLIVHKKIGDRVAAGDVIATIHHRAGKGLEECQRLLGAAYAIGDAPAKPGPLVAEVIR